MPATSTARRLRLIRDYTLLLPLFSEWAVRKIPSLSLVRVRA